MLISGFSAGEVQKLTGLTYRQLDHWARTEFIEPSTIEKIGLKTRRLYSFTDILAIRTAMQLLDAGIPLQRLRKAVNKLQKELPKKEALHSLVWLTDGEKLFILESRDIVREVISGKYIFAFTIDVGQLADGLENDVKIFEGRQRSGGRRRYKVPDISAVSM